MSNAFAIATVTAALGKAVERSIASVNGAKVQFGRPTADGDTRVHIYLYQVSPHAALRNADLPTRGVEGRLVQRPQAALELHYLLSFHGDEEAHAPQLMLAAVARDLHAQPLLGADDIAAAVDAPSSPVQESDLGASVARIRFTPASLSLDELSKLWSVMVQTPHALSLVYTASVVLLDALERATPALPVLRRGPEDHGPEAVVGPFPRLDDAWLGFPASVNRRPPLPSLRAAALGARLLIDGRNLAGDVVTLRFEHALRPPQDVVIAAADRDGGQLRLTLPDDGPAQTAWAAGLYGVVAHVQRGAAVVRAPVWPLLLAPRITKIDPPSPIAGAGGTVTLTVTCRPQVQPDQAVTLVLADRELAAEPHAATTERLDFVLKPAPPLADALVRLRVDGVESLPMRIDAAGGHFVFDDAQRVTIT